MAAKRNLLSRIRLVYRRSSTLLKCVVLTAIVLSTVCLIALRGVILETRRKTDELRIQAAELEQRNRRLERYIAGIGTVEGIKNIAADKLGLVDPDTIIFQSEED